MNIDYNNQSIVKHEYTIPVEHISVVGGIGYPYIDLKSNLYKYLSNTYGIEIEDIEQITEEEKLTSIVLQIGTYRFQIPLRSEDSVNVFQANNIKLLLQFETENK